MSVGNFRKVTHSPAEASFHLQFGGVLVNVGVESLAYASGQ